MKDTLNSNTQKTWHILPEINITEWFFNQDGWMYNSGANVLEYQITIVQIHIKKQLYLPFVHNNLQMTIIEMQTKE